MIAVLLPTVVSLIMLAGVLAVVAVIIRADRLAELEAELADIEAWFDQVRESRKAR